VAAISAETADQIHDMQAFLWIYGRSAHEIYSLVQLAGNGRLVSIGSHYRGVVRWVDWYGDGSLWVLNVALACCTLEFDAASSATEGPLEVLDDRAQAAVVISGTVTDRLAPAVAAIVDGCELQTGRRPTVISFGACASSGGPYWDSYAVTKGVDQLLAVDAYVPGCPPPPEALSAVLDQVAGRVNT
jgi:NADH-quinone oxidoreductase subunit B